MKHRNAYGASVSSETKHAQIERIIHAQRSILSPEELECLRTELQRTLAEEEAQYRAQGDPQRGPFSTKLYFMYRFY